LKPKRMLEYALLQILCVLYPGLAQTIHL
jgi:hypothetical protein